MYGDQGYVKEFSDDIEDARDKVIGSVERLVWQSTIRGATTSHTLVQSLPLECRWNPCLASKSGIWQT